MDWVPAHFPKDAHALAEFDAPIFTNTWTAPRRATGLGQLIFNFGRNEVRNFLIGTRSSGSTNITFDGLRVDAVASMLYLDYSRTRPMDPMFTAAARTSMPSIFETLQRSLLRAFSLES